MKRVPCKASMLTLLTAPSLEPSTSITWTSGLKTWWVGVQQAMGVRCQIAPTMVFCCLPFDSERQSSTTTTYLKRTSSTKKSLSTFSETSFSNAASFWATRCCCCCPSTSWPLVDREERGLRPARLRSIHAPGRKKKHSDAEESRFRYCNFFACLLWVAWCPRLAGLTG